MADAAPAVAPVPATPAPASPPPPEATPGTLSANPKAPPKPAKVVKPTPVAPKPKAQAETAGMAGGAQLTPEEPEEGAGGEEEAAAPPELYDVIINGQKRQLTREQMVARAQKTEAAHQQFQKAAALAKQAQEAIARLEKDPLAVLLERGIDVGALSTKHLAERAEEALLSPEQRELKAAHAELAKYKAADEKNAAAAKEAEQRAAYDKVAEHLEKSFIAASERAGLEQSPDALEMMSVVAQEAIELELEMTVDQVAQEAKDRLDQLASKRDAKVASGLTGERLLGYLGEKTVDAVLAASLERMKKTNAAKVARPPPVESPEKKPNGGSDFISSSEWARL